MGSTTSTQQARWGIWVLVVLLLPAAITDIRDAQTRPFWADEICTAAVAQLATPSAIWSALAHAADTQPPFFYMAAALGAHVVGDEHLGFRLPALVGFYCVPFCLYLFIGRRTGVIGGLVAALVPVLSGFQGYATEARPYGLEVGCLALGLLFWQRVETSRWFSLPMSLSLAGAVASHYYGVLAIPAFFLAEAVRAYRTRQVRYASLAAVVASLTPFLLALPVMRSARDFYGAHFWAGRSLEALALSYSNLTGLGSLFTTGTLLVLVTIMLNKMFSVWTTTHVHDLEPPVSVVQPEECALAVYFLCLPVVTYVAVTLTQGGLLMRYVLPTVLGLASAAGVAAVGLGRNTAVAVLAVLIVNHEFLTLLHGRSVFHARSRSVVENSLSPQLKQMLRDFPTPGPVVISSGTDYLPLAYYSPPEIQTRITVLVDPPAALASVGTDSVDLEVMALKPYLPINAQLFSAFRDANQRFLLFSSGSSWDWWPARLGRDGHVLTLRLEQGRYRLYEVELKP